MSTKHLTEQQFIEFTLEESLQQGLRDAGFAYCTPIQAACLPAALEGKDVAGQAQTGTGKTVAFLLACCHYLLTHPAAPKRLPTQPRALILAPTRELAIQIYRDAEVLSRHTGFALGLVYGGTGYDQQKAMLTKGADILIGTPGRLIDFFKQGLYNLEQAQVAVMDEADRMFDLGFIKDIRYLLRRMPPAEERLNLLFSATLSFKVMEMAYEHMNDPEEIKIIGDAVVVDKVTECSYYPADEEKLPLLLSLLKRDSHERALVFVNTRHGVEKVANTLAANGIRNAALSGDVPQHKREQLLESFKRGEHNVLVATDVAARGLHIPAVSHVYNFDLPQDADDYIHRIGRTARAGASGEAISFVCERHAYSIMEIEAHIGHALPRQDIDPQWLEGMLKGAAPRPRNRAERGANGVGRGRGAKPPATRKAHPAADKITKQTPPRAQDTQPPIIETGELNAAPMAARADSPRSDSAAVDSPLADTVVEAVVETRPPQPTRRPATPAAMPPLPTHRFSRRYGEIPAIG